MPPLFPLSLIQVFFFETLLSIFIAHCTSSLARILLCEDCSIYPVVPFRGNFFARNSLVCLDVGFFICRFSSMRFHLTTNVAAPAVVLFQSFSIASRKMSASGAPTNVAFPPSPTHLFTACSSARLSHKYSMGLVTGVPCNVKTKTASSGQFELDPSSSRPTFLCYLFRFTLPAPIFPPFWLDPSPAVIVPRKP